MSDSMFRGVRAAIEEVVSAAQKACPEGKQSDKVRQMADNLNLLLVADMSVDQSIEAISMTLDGNRMNQLNLVDRDGMRGGKKNKQNQNNNRKNQPRNNKAAALPDKDIIMTLAKAGMKFMENLVVNNNLEEPLRAFLDAVADMRKCVASKSDRRMLHTRAQRVVSQLMAMVRSAADETIQKVEKELSLDKAAINKSKNFSLDESLFRTTRADYKKLLSTLVSKWQEYVNGIVNRSSLRKLISGSSDGYEEDLVPKTVSQSLKVLRAVSCVGAVRSAGALMEDWASMKARKHGEPPNLMVFAIFYAVCDVCISIMLVAVSYVYNMLVPDSKWSVPISGLVAQLVLSIIVNTGAIAWAADVVQDNRYFDYKQQHPRAIRLMTNVATVTCLAFSMQPFFSSVSKRGSTLGTTIKERLVELRDNAAPKS